MWDTRIRQSLSKRGFPDEDRSHFEGELLLRVIAVAAINARFLEIRHLFRAAVGTADLAIRPTDFDHEVPAILVVGEVLDGFLRCSRRADNVLTYA